MMHQDLGQNVPMLANCLEMAEKSPCLCLSQTKQMGNWIQWQVEWLVVVVGRHEVIGHHDKGVVQGEVQRKLRVPNLRSKVDWFCCVLNLQPSDYTQI